MDYQNHALTDLCRIIAIMLGRLGMSVDECIRVYQKMAEWAFTRKRTAKSILPSAPKFSANALEAAMREAVKEFCPMPECVAQRRGGGSSSSTCSHDDAQFRDDACTATLVRMC